VPDNAFLFVSRFIRNREHASVFEEMIEGGDLLKGLLPISSRLRAASTSTYHISNSMRKDFKNLRSERSDSRTIKENLRALVYNYYCQIVSGMNFLVLDCFQSSPETSVNIGIITLIPSPSGWEESYDCICCSLGHNILQKFQVGNLRPSKIHSHNWSTINNLGTVLMSCKHSLQSRSRFDIWSVICSKCFFGAVAR